MAIIHTQNSNCPENSGLSEATVRVIVNPNMTEARIANINFIMSQISENEFEHFVFNILSDPTVWTIQTVTQTDFGQRIRSLGRNYYFIKDVTCTHTILRPHEILLTIEIDFQNFQKVSTYSTARVAVLHEFLELVQNHSSILIRWPDSIFSRANHAFFRKFSFILQNWILCNDGVQKTELMKMGSDFLEVEDLPHSRANQLAQKYF